MKTDALALLRIFWNVYYYFRTIRWWKNVNSFEIAKVQLDGVRLAFP